MFFEIIVGCLTEFLFEGFVEVAFVGEAKFGGYFWKGEVAALQTGFDMLEFVVSGGRGTVRNKLSLNQTLTLNQFAQDQLWSFIIYSNFLGS